MRKPQVLCHWYLQCSLLIIMLEHSHIAIDFGQKLKHRAGFSAPLYLAYSILSMIATGRRAIRRPVQVDGPNFTYFRTDFELPLFASFSDIYDMGENVSCVIHGPQVGVTNLKCTTAGSCPLLQHCSSCFS